MFAIYGVSGPLFHGTLDALSRMPQLIRRRGPVRPARPVADDVEVDTATVNNVTGVAGPGVQAVDAYKSMLPDSLDRGPLYHANQIMTLDVISVNANDEVAHAWRTLSGNRIRQTPVLDETGRLCGLVSERNLLTTLNVDDGEVRDVLSKQVRDVMTTPVVAAGPGTDIRLIARLMLNRDVEGVPIISESGALLGFISRSDILRAVVTDPPLSIWR